MPYTAIEKDYMIHLEKAHAEFIEKLKNEGKSPSTVIAYKKDIEQLAEHLLKQGVEKVHEIELDHLVDFMSTLSDQGLTNKTISRKTNATKTFFRYLQIEEYIQVNVAEDLEHPEVMIKPPRILSKLEYRALRDTAREDTRTFAIIETLLQTGISISELAGMKVADLKLENDKGTLYIPARGSKENRTVPLNKAAVEAIRNYMDKDRPAKEGAEYVFITKTGNPMLVRNIRSTIDRYFEQAGIEDAKVNDLRHTFIAHHLMQGTSLQTVSRVVGHKRISTTEKYLEHVNRETEEEKMELGVL